MQKKTEGLIENNQDVAQLKREVEILLSEKQSKSDIIKNLKDQLKDAKNEVQLIEKINEELQRKLNLAEANLNSVREESTVLMNSKYGEFERLL